MEEFQQRGKLIKGCNATFITSILKVEDPLTLSNFHPNSLVNCQYKILSKVLMERLTKVVPSNYLWSSIEFLGSRRMLDSNLIANEVVNWAAKAKKKLFCCWMYTLLRLMIALTEIFLIQ